MLWKHPAAAGAPAQARRDACVQPDSAGRKDRDTMRLIVKTLLIVLTGALAIAAPAGAAPEGEPLAADIAIYGGTPGGIAAALAAARLGSSVVLVDRNAHIGGLMSNGLGATDIKKRGAVGGIFLEFVRAVRDHYAKQYGEDSQQVKDCNNGYYFEPHVAELLFERMLAAQRERITVFRRCELEAAHRKGNRLSAFTFRSLETGERRTVRAKVFIDATYEGDLAAMAGVPYRVGREPRRLHGEPYAGVIYWGYQDKIYYDDESTGEGDSRIQAYNYRLCLTDRPDNRVPIEKPANYDPREYRILRRQIWAGQVKSFHEVVHVVRMPNGKSDTNNHTIPLLSTDLPEENYPYPEAGWKWREKFAERLRDYTLGLLYFCQNDPTLPESFRAEARRWGLAADEYTDNGNFPRQIYVREARRIVGEYDFRAQDCLLDPRLDRTPVQPASIGCGSYEMDSHATRKYEPGYPVLEGLLGVWQYSQPYQVPYGVIVPRKVDGLLVTGAISGTHMGFSTLRMEPCWMAMGQAAGTAAHLAIKSGVEVRRVDMLRLQRQLLEDGAVIMYFEDVQFQDPHAKAIQFFATHGGTLFPTYYSRQNVPATRAEAAQYLDLARRLGLWSRRPQKVRGSFVDVPDDHPAAPAIRALAGRGLFQRELREGEFRPLESITPNQLRRWFQEAGLDIQIPDSVGRAWVRRGPLLGMLYTLTEKLERK